MSRHENSVSARVGSDAAMWRRFLARNTSRNSEVETGASRSASVANIGLRSFESLLRHGSLSLYNFQLWLPP